MVAELAPPAAAAAPNTEGPSGTVELRGLTKRYGDEAVDDAIAVSIAPRRVLLAAQTLGVEGKTTTLMMVAGFTLRPGWGRHRFVDGEDIAGGATAEARVLAWCFNELRDLPCTSMFFENIAFPLRAALGEGCDRRARELGTRTGAARAASPTAMPAPAFRRATAAGRPGAAAIVFHPPVMLMDEPLGALDKNLRFDDAGRDQGDPAASRHDRALVTSRDQERGDEHVRPHRHHEPRSDLDQVGTPGEVYERPANPFVEPLSTAKRQPDRRPTVMAEGRQDHAAAPPFGQESARAAQQLHQWAQICCSSGPSGSRSRGSDGRGRNPGANTLTGKVPPLLVSWQYSALCR